MSKKLLTKYLNGKDIKLEKVYTSIGVIKIVSAKKLIANELKYISYLELETKEYTIAKKKKD